MAKFLFLALFAALLGCVAGQDCAPGCTGSNGDCMTCSGSYSCNSGGTCSAAVNGVACCTGLGGGGSGSCNPGYCLSGGHCCPSSTPWYDPGGHGYGAGCYASCPYVGDCSNSKTCY